MIERFSVYFFALFFLFSCVFSLLINGLLLRFSKNLGMRNLDQSIIRWSSTQKPALGGISFYIVFLLSTVFYSEMFVSESTFRNLQFLGILSSVSVGFLMGLADDAYNTRPLLKFGVQFLCGLILVLTGTSIQFFGNLFMDGVITIIWVIGIMNSVNMLDNMDSITTSVSLFIVLSCLIIAGKAFQEYDIYFFLMLGVGAALLGFLFFNWHPSKMFMGDTGSQFLGVFLAAMGILFLWNPIKGESMMQSKQLILIVLAFLLPISDTTTVTINRLLKGSSPFVGGKDHTTHHLSYLGLSDRQVALVFIVLSLLSVLFITLITYVFKEWTMTLFWLFGIYALIVFAFLYLTTRFTHKP